MPVESYDPADYRFEKQIEAEEEREARMSTIVNYCPRCANTHKCPDDCTPAFPVIPVTAPDVARETTLELTRTLRSRINTRWPVSHQQGWFAAANDLETFAATLIRTALEEQTRELREALAEIISSLPKNPTVCESYDGCAYDNTCRIHKLSALRDRAEAALAAQEE